MRYMRKETTVTAYGHAMNSQQYCLHRLLTNTHDIMLTSKILTKLILPNSQQDDNWLLIKGFS